MKAVIANASRPGEGRRSRPGWAESCRAIGVVAIGAFVFVPMTILALYSVSAQWNAPYLLPTAYTFKWYAYLFRYEGGLSAVVQSTVVATVTTAVTLLVGLPAAYGLARQRFWGRRVFEFALLAKTAVPVILVGVGTASLFYAWGLHDTFLGLVGAHSVGALPLQVWTAAAAFQGVDEAQEEAARDLGASFVRRFVEIVLPQALPGIIASAILVFLFSMDEFTITFFVSGVAYATMPLRLYSALNSGYIEPAAASAMILLLPSILYLALVLRYFGSSELRGGLGSLG